MPVVTSRDAASLSPAALEMTVDEAEEIVAAAVAEKKKKSGMQKLFNSAFKRTEASSRVSSDASGGGSSDLISGSSDSESFRFTGGKPPVRGWRGRKVRSDDSASVGSSSHGSGDRDSSEFDGLQNPKAILALRNAKIGHDCESYHWERKMRELLPRPNSSCFLSLLILPKASDASNTRYNSLEDTLARTDAWLVSSQASGVPIVFSNIQTEALLTKISGEMALSTVNMASLADLANMANVSLYGFEDYHGVDIGVVRAVRLWYAPVAGEISLEITLQRGDSRLGFSIGRTEEGFIYISLVEEENSPGVAACRSGLPELYKEARKADKRLVISRVGDEKVLPWLVSTEGAIKCFNTVSLSQKLSLHRHALRPIVLHFLMWDEICLTSVAEMKVDAEKPPAELPVPLPLQLGDEEVEYVPNGFSFRDDDDQAATVTVRSKDPGDSSFRFQNIKLPDSWV